MVFIDFAEPFEADDFQGKKLTALEYADNICLIARSIEDMGKMLQNLEEQAMKFGQKIAEMRIIMEEKQEKLYLKGKEIQKVDEFCYLGSITSRAEGAELDIKHRIWKARGAFAKMKNIWLSTKLSLRAKRLIFNSNVKSVLL